MEVTMSREVHAIPIGTTHHSGHRNCGCGPKAYTDLLEPSRPIFVHRKPEPIPPRLRGDALATARRNQ